MYIIISVQGCFPSLILEIDEDGDVLVFDTAEEAEAYAQENCAWNYKIIEWDK